MQSGELKALVVAALEDMKGHDITCVDVSSLTNITDHMVIVSGTSNRHVRSLADTVLVKAKERGVRAIGVEGEELGEWILVDLGDVVVHAMLPKAREFYDLERLWTTYPNTLTTAAP